MINHLGVHNSVLETIGGTPLVRLRHLVGADCAEVLVKIEGGNPTGSYKDRMALAIIEGAERRGLLQQGNALSSSAAAVLALPWRLSARLRDTPFPLSPQMPSPWKST